MIGLDISAGRLLSIAGPPVALAGILLSIAGPPVALAGRLLSIAGPPVALSGPRVKMPWFGRKLLFISCVFLLLLFIFECALFNKGLLKLFCSLLVLGRSSVILLHNLPTTVFPIL